MLLNNIKNFIDTRIREHPQISPWLEDWSPDHETQILTDTDGLEPCGPLNRPTHWVDDDGVEHRHLRIPRDAMTDNPKFKDRQVYGPVHHRWQFIGTTGWDWQRKKSMWVGFDFDSLTNHTEGLTTEQLGEVLDRAK